jgi:hypothetical protein
MSQRVYPKFVAGIVDVDPNMTREQNRETPYAFWEIDTTDEKAHQQVLDVYKKFEIDMCSQRVGKGFHYFGEKVPRAIWKEWHEELINLVGNKKFPALTLRITRKFAEEVFERPVYHQVRDPPQDHHRALMHFIVKEMKNQNSTYLERAAHDCGLDKYYKVVPYPLCPICLISWDNDLETHIKQKHNVLSDLRVM